MRDDESHGDAHALIGQLHIFIKHLLYSGPVLGS